ncbi:MAG: RNA pyrophosphohydrolase [Burkholderiales bacterium]|jgi:putative (di)nucleoside polyphosphate hydrolase
MIDEEGYRLNVGIILLNQNNQVFWGRRKGENSWQFPQGGIYDEEQADEAMFRELNEELGLLPKHVEIIARTKDWLYYDVPGVCSRAGKGVYRGQKQIWYLLRFLGKDYHINVKFHKEQEFDAWRWIDYWSPIDQVVKFKQEVYAKSLTELFEYIKV